MACASVGIDCGSAACKGVLLREGAIVARCALPTGWSPKETARGVLQALLREAALERADVAVVVTGYGRVGVDFADRAVTEITCHALGAEWLLPGARTVIDIGGQDAKVIAMERGKVLDFHMNDKCAAGTGRFLEMSALRMGVEVAEFPALLRAGKHCALSSLCAVFADAEIVSLLAAGKSREEIAGGIVRAVVARAVTIAARIDVRPPVLFTGGLAGLECLRAALGQELGCAVETSTDSWYAGALGAARAYVCERGGPPPRA